MLGWLLLHAGIGAGGTWLARSYALQRDLLDHPGERRSHAVATPRGGGIAVVLALLVAAIALAVRDPSQRPVLVAFATGLALVAGVGMVDDHRPLSPWWRLSVHVLAALLFAAVLQFVHGQWWLSLLALLAVLALTNIWNFMDGINGIAASQALLLGLAMAWTGGGAWAWLALALAAACAGFLPFNFPRARIFMGDVGSGAIGFAVAAIAAMVVGGRGVGPGVAMLLPLSAFLVDAGLTLARRMLRGEQWWLPHTQHAYQVWARRSGHAFVTSAYVAWTALGVLAMVVLLRAGVSFTTLMAICAGWYMATGVAWLVLQGMGAATGAATGNTMNKDSE
jgi:UDP-N-acetylmuramyl pentapeptide phosphotransferase/UDP-N-acetylglucosamine-1-phosphate transferase